MKFSRIGRVSLALAASIALGLSMTACGGGTIAYMWVVGTQLTGTNTSTIVGFKVDQYTGNLTAVPKSPFGSGGANPTNVVVRPGGRFLYVVNQGTPINAGVNNGIKTPDGSIAEFSVGGDGTLTFQQSFGTAGGSPIWAAIDSSGSYLYALDAIAPVGSSYYNARLGDITVFSIAADTGRLSLVTNQQVRDSNNVNLNYFPVGANPTMVKVSSASCLYVVDKNQPSDPHPTALFPYQIGTGGQLTQTVTTQISVPNATNVTSVNVGGGNGTGTSTGGTYVYTTDTGPLDASGNPTQSGSVQGFSTGTNCALNSVTNANQPVVAPGQYPVWAQTEARGNRLYVLAQATTNSNFPYSSISAYTINSDGSLTILAGTNPYPVGAGPTCMAEDPTNQYVYTSNSVDGTLTGKAVNGVQGELTDLPRGSKFAAVSHATCLAISGSVD